MPMGHIARNVLVPIAAFVAAYIMSALLFPLYLFAPLTLLLALITLLYLRVSPISGAAAILGIALAFWGQFGALGAAVALLMYAPGAAAAVFCLRKGYRLLDAVCFTAAACIAGVACAYGLVTLLAGDAVTLISRLLNALYIDADPQTQRMLYPIMNPLLGGAQADTFEQMRDRVAALLLDGEAYLRLMLPSMLLEYAAVSGFLAVIAPRFMLLRSARDEGFARFTPVHKWRVPRNVQTGLAVLFFASLLGSLMGIPSMSAVFQAIWTLLVAVYAVMGCAFADRWMFKVGVKPGARMLTLLAAYLFLRMPLFILGMAEVLMQSINKRKAEHEGGV